MKFSIPHVPIGWNEYIKAERRSLYIANDIKQKEKIIVKMATRGLKWEGGYPISIKFYVHFKDKRRDLDNTRLKGVLDGLVSAGIIKNDNLNCIQEILIAPIFDDLEQLDIEIKKID